ncbi:unnamed protein product, partial [Hydatigera taeniaeformis]|uniref:Uncharacterized protein n=1 Tax=Hydatigena taeniaeformis TaxID=6205 RepID=A0A0R3WW54_HYDTA
MSAGVATGNAADGMRQGEFSAMECVPHEKGDELPPPSNDKGQNSGLIETSGDCGIPTNTSV